MNVKIFTKVCLVALMVSAVGTAQAQKKQGLLKKADQHMSGQGYGMAGCGLGSVVLGNEPGFIQIFAVTLNSTSLNQSFGISTGTSNCGESGRSARTDQFIEVNQVALENELSRGQGETLTALSQVMGCQNESFTQGLKSGYNQIKSQSAKVTAEQIKVMAEKSCQI